MFLRVFDETIRFTKPRDNDKQLDTKHDEERDKPDEEADKKPADLKGEDRGKRREAKPGMKEDTFSLREGVVVLQWPETLSAESYEDLEDWTKLLLRKIKRSVSGPTGDTGTSGPTA